MMKCPKCNFQQKKSLECINCGIIISKYKKKEAPSFSKIIAENKQKILSASKRNTIIKIILLAAIIVFGISLFQKDKLPPAEQIYDELFQEPVQTETDSDDFETEVGGVVYTVSPLYNYELYGLVVSFHHSSSWWDITHRRWGDFINLKDICILWGENMETEAYRSIKFSNGMFTCYAECNDAKAWSNFSINCLSNNHLLSDNKEQNKTIMEVKKGDQIYLRGYLAEYSHSNNSFKRGSSTTRTDTGNGACETIYLEDFQIIKKANPSWRLGYSFSKYLIIGCVALLVFFFFKDPVRAE